MRCAELWIKRSCSSGPRRTSGSLSKKIEKIPSMRISWRTPGFVEGVWCTPYGVEATKYRCTSMEFARFALPLVETCVLILAP